MTEARRRLRYPEYVAHLYIGIKGTVLAIDRATGETVWNTPLKGGEFVNVVLDGDELYAATRGELYRLDPATGNILWKNELEGMGWGLIAIARAPDGNWNAMQEKKRQDDAAAAGALSTV